MRFDLFPALPVEIRLEIWRLACPARVVEVQLHVPRESDQIMSEIHLYLRPLSRPSLPVILHICRESRDEALAIHRPCAGLTFASPHPFPYNLYHPVLDTLFIPVSMHMIEAYRLQQQQSLSPAAVLGLVLTRDFILDHMAANPGDVASIRSLAISWAVMHIKDVSMLVEAFRPYVALRELSLVFFETRGTSHDIRLQSMRTGQMRAVLVDPSESAVRGRHFKRVFKEFMKLADTFNASLLELDSAMEPTSDRRQKKLPLVKVRMVRFES